MHKTSSRKIKVLLVDDHFVVRMGLAAVISLEPDMEVVGEADSGEAGIRQAKLLNPDVIVMDLLMPHMNGDVATAEIRAKQPDAKILILTSFGNANELSCALKAGATGALAKTSSQPEILDAIRRIAVGETPENSIIPHPLLPSNLHPLLSERQTEILGLVARGFTNQDIAKGLHITIETVKDHLKKIFAQLGASSRTEASTIATDLGLISRS